MRSLPVYYIARETYDEQVREPVDDGWDQGDYQIEVSIVACSFLKPIVSNVVNMEWHFFRRNSILLF